MRPYRLYTYFNFKNNVKILFFKYFILFFYYNIMFYFLKNKNINSNVTINALIVVHAFFLHACTSLINEVHALKTR